MAIIIHWNQEELTRDAIRSLLQTGYTELKIILVDNGSINGSGERIAADYPDIWLVRSNENLGYAGGANLGLAASLETDAPYFFLLNNDVTFDPAIIDELVHEMENEGNEDVGICVAKIYLSDNPKKIWYAGGEIDQQRTGLCKHLGYGQVDGPAYEAQRDCTFANGCAMFIRREVLENVGFLDTSYFHTGEDVDYSLRLLAKGYRIVFVPKARLWHKIRSSACEKQKATYNYLYYEHRNRMLIMRKYFRGKQNMKSYLTLAKFYIGSVINEIKSGNTEGARGILRGLIDGYKGISGKGEVS
jgi:GT2 family glycosyltransferase